MYNIKCKRFYYQTDLAKKKKKKSLSLFLIKVHIYCIFPQPLSFASPENTGLQNNFLSGAVSVMDY